MKLHFEKLLLMGILKLLKFLNNKMEFKNKNHFFLFIITKKHLNEWPPFEEAFE